jgi:hypothetical protein
MALNFTDDLVASLRLEEIFCWITDAACPNLRLRIGATGKVWYHAYRKPDGTYASQKLGPVEAIPLSEARRLAGEMNKARQAERESARLAGRGKNGARKRRNHAKDG